jgi:hypothetical protein
MSDAAQYLALAAQAAESVTNVQLITEQARQRGLQAAVEAADIAYTAAVQAAANTGAWSLVSVAAAALHQARAALVGGTD